MDFEVQTERLLLRSLTASDRKAWIRVHERSEAHLRPWSPQKTGTWDDMFDEVLEKATTSEQHLKCVMELGDGDLAGLINLNQIVLGVFENAYAGWLLGVEYTGSGHATEGVTALLDVASSRQGLGLHRVAGQHHPGKRTQYPSG